MATNLNRVIGAFNGRPWAIEESKLLEITAMLERRLTGAPKLTAAEMAAIRENRARPMFTPRGAVAVIPMHGVLAQRLGMMEEISGGTSTEALAAAIRDAADDPNISAIVLDVDSPGGAVDAGLVALSSAIYAARAQKRVVAVARGAMCSAAYWAGSAADEVVAEPFSAVGSIGVFATHIDRSAAEAQAGVKTTLISAGRFKVDGNPHEPLSDTAREHLQAMADEAYGEFVRAVAKHRGVSADDVRSGYGEGRALMPNAALKAGLIDRVATLDAVIEELSGAKPAQRRRMAAEAPTVTLAASDTTAPEWMAAVADALATVRATNTSTTDWTFAADGAATAEDDSPDTTPAPEARSEAMSDVKVTAAPDTGADQIAAERARVSALYTLGSEHEMEVGTVQGWIDAGVTPEAASAEILRKQRARGPNISVGTQRETQRPWAADEFGIFARSVYASGIPTLRDTVDVRIYGATGMQQAVGSDGGFLVPPQFSAAIWDGMQADDSNLLAMTDQYTVEGESLTFNANAETSRANGSRFGGVQGYWMAEAAQMTGSRPKFRQLKLEPHQMGVLIYATDKLLTNAQALGQYLTRASTEEILFKTGDAIVNGTGAGQPLGLMGSGSLVTVAKETNQAAATIVQANISKMWARLHPRARKNAIWLHNVDVEPQLDALSTTVMNVAGTENVGGYANKVFDAERRTLKGRPLVASEFCATLGTVGDLILWSPGFYAAGVRGGVQSAVSIHLKFDYNETAFRFIYEVDGQPWLASALTPFKGSNTLTTHVALATRS